MVAAAATAVILALPGLSAPGARGDESRGAAVWLVAAVILRPLSLPLLLLLLPPRLLPVVVVVVAAAAVVAVVVVSAVVDADIAEGVGGSAEVTPASLRGAVVVGVGDEGKAGGGWDRCWPWPCRR